MSESLSFSCEYRVEDGHLYCAAKRDQNTLHGNEKKKWKEVKSQKFQHQQWACHGCQKSKWSKRSRKQRVKGRGWQMWIAHTHTSLDTLSAGDLKIYSSTYPILRYSYHTNCKMMRQGIALVVFSPSSFYINHLENSSSIICYLEDSNDQLP